MASVAGFMILPTSALLKLCQDIMLPVAKVERGEEQQLQPNTLILAALQSGCFSDRTCPTKATWKHISKPT